MDTKKIAKRIVEESVVLLKNENQTLPFPAGKQIAFFGRAQWNTYYSGNGSGASQASEIQSILEECEQRSLCVEPGLKSFYQRKLAKETKRPEIDFSKIDNAVNSGIMYEIFGKYQAPEPEYQIPEDLMKQAVRFTDTAVLVLGRNSGGEECDRHLDEDYYLTASEEQLVKQICNHFNHVILILNINGLIDLAWTKRYQAIKSILFMGICGEQGAAALADILTGKVNPSGKLPVTIAEKFEDYPSSRHFSWNKDCAEQIFTYESYGLNAGKNGSTGFTKSPVTVYWEDIYMGYRYFDTFHCEPLFPFGFGLSYTRFEVGVEKIVKRDGGLEITSQVVNIGDRAGREVLQTYVSATDTGSERPQQELKGFGKTNLLNPGDCEEVTLFLPWPELAVYNTKKAAFIIEKGRYQICIGNSSRNTQIIAEIIVQTDIMTQKCQNRLELKECNREKLKFLSQRQDNSNRPDDKNNDRNICVLTLLPEDVQKYRNCDLTDTYENTQTLEKFSIEELAALCVGYGPGTPFSAFGDGSDPETIYDEEGMPITTNSHPVGFNGYVSPAIEEKSIYSVFYKDGPSGIGETAWPSEMLLACAFDRKLWRTFGDAIGRECEKQQVDVWLAPAVNLHRNPLCGRNFEYISEDPFLTGICACEITQGVQSNHNVLVCPKHFAVNEQETYRRGSEKKNYDAADSIVSERAARELYLKPFEMLVKYGNIACIMTSFNKINGVFAGGNKDLCTHILREEWGFDGAVVTDWGDMDIVVDGADAVAAGNDIVMPGGPPVIRQLIKGYGEGRVTRKELETAVGHLLIIIRKIYTKKKKHTDRRIIY